MDKYTVKVEGRYAGALRCTATHGPSGATIETDAPKDNEGRGEAFSPTDLVGTALGTCICTILGIVGRRRGLDLDGMRFSVSKQMATEPRRRIGRLEVDLYLPADLSAEERTVLENAAKTCPVHASLHPDVDAPLSFHYDI